MKDLSLQQQDILTVLKANFTEKHEDAMIKFIKSVFGKTATTIDILIAIDNFTEPTK